MLVWLQIGKLFHLATWPADDEAIDFVSCSHAEVQTLAGLTQKPFASANGLNGLQIADFGVRVRQNQLHAGANGVAVGRGAVALQLDC